MVHSLISSIGLMSTEFSDTKRIQVINPSRATYKELAFYHDRDYLDFVLDPTNSTNSEGNSEFGLEDVSKGLCFFLAISLIFNTLRTAPRFRNSMIMSHL